jgi:hypothetical protein
MRNYLLWWRRYQLCYRLLVAVWTNRSAIYQWHYELLQRHLLAAMCTIFPVRLSFASIVALPSVSGYMIYPSCHLSVAMQSIYHRMHQKWRTERVSNFCVLYIRTRQIPGTISPWYLEILPWHLVFLRIIFCSLRLFCIELSSCCATKLLMWGSEQRQFAITCRQLRCVVGGVSFICSAVGIVKSGLRAGQSASVLRSTHREWTQRMTP